MDRGQPAGGTVERMMRGLGKAAGAAVIAAVLGSAASAGCGEAQTACSVEGGLYHIVLPEREAEGSAVPVVMFLHGYGGSGPQSWGFGPFTGGRDEGAFFAAVLADAAESFGTSRSQTVLAGFSAGAFMVHYLACRDPAAFAAYAPVSGAFWRPQPERCAGPLRLLQVHGWRDEVVPLEGRILGGGRFEQGDVFAALEVWREANACTSHAPDRAWSANGLMRRRWDCGPGADIELVLFDGGHSVPKGWAALMADWFEDQPAVR